MSYTIGEHHDGGYDYTITVNGMVTKGWRKGSRKDVEAHVKQSHELWSERADNSGRNKSRWNVGASVRHRIGPGRRKKVVHRQDAEDIIDADGF